VGPMKVVPNDDELREQRKQIYDDKEPNHYRREDLAEEYALTQGKREFAEDAWRAVIYFLHRKGFTLLRDGVEYDLLGSPGYEPAARDS
jgi:hypothetical protein